jgi:hypothetical protein
MEALKPPKPEPPKKKRWRNPITARHVALASIRRAPRISTDGLPDVYGHLDQWDVNDEIELLREGCRRNFWTFFNLAFGDGLSDKGRDWIDPKVHKPIAEWYEAHIRDWMARRGTEHALQKHLAVLLPREVGKSRMITAAGQAWLHLLDPEISTYTGSESSELAQKILTIIKSVLSGADPHGMFSKLYGNWATNASVWSAKSVIHAGRRFLSRGDPSLGTFSVETSITGAHPDAIFYDDPISYERLISDQNWLQTVNSQVTSLGYVIQSDGLVVWVGTRYSDDDHFGIAFREEGVASLSGMATDSIQVDADRGRWHVYFLAGKDHEGEPTCPKTWPPRRLAMEEKREPHRFASQVMNDPTLSETNPITREQLRQCFIKAEEVPWSALTYAFLCDTAFWDGKSRVRKDETVIQVWGYPRNGSGDIYYIEGYGSATWRAEDFGNRLVSMVQRYRRQGRRVVAITDEVTMSGKKDAWKLALRNFFSDVNEPMPNFIQFDRQSRKKSQRMNAAAAFWVDGHVRVIEGAPGAQQLMEQMAKISQYMLNDKLKDDWCDVASDAVHPDLYQPMRRIGNQKAPWQKGAQLLAVDGLDPDMFTEDIYGREDGPRPPIR